jgi:hypothetical protein
MTLKLLAMVETLKEPAQAPQLTSLQTARTIRSREVSKSDAWHEEPKSASINGEISMHPELKPWIRLY